MREKGVWPGLQLTSRLWLAVHGWQQWRELLPGWNWHNFTLINLALEWGGYKGRYIEIEMGLLGLNVTVELYDQWTREIELEPLRAKFDDWCERHGTTEGA